MSTNPLLLNLGLGNQTKEDLKMHIEADQNGDKTFDCEYCGVDF